MYNNDLEGAKRAYPLERGWVKYKLIRELAQGIKSQAKLAEEYGVNVGSIAKFKTRHQTEIDETAAGFEDEFAALWVAQKAQRLAELQSDIDAIDSDADPDRLKIKHAALKQVAEELGQLPSRMAVNVNTAPVTYKIEGVDMDKLR